MWTGAVDSQSSLGRPDEVGTADNGENQERVHKKGNPIWTSAESVKAKITRISIAFLLDKPRDASRKVLARIVISCEKRNEDFDRPPRGLLLGRDLLTL